MYHKMITKFEEYQEEALEFEALVMATLLHPAFHLRFFAHCWPEREQHMQLLLEKNSQIRELESLHQKSGLLSNTSCKVSKEPFNMVESISFISMTPFKDISCPIVFG
ncbi:hypothetical protein VP01_2646g4 [Puccinia sorghi]|uniref:Uncharacterized protein n=1 Tax=Puccinia sorghi TaxID=27349 RepID=A0A0L6V484_9BASI|nr:hypothetical protein VP01_2646g4 [Puccinia sorghi]